jgi:hypothetical protein
MDENLLNFENRFFKEMSFIIKHNKRGINEWDAGTRK